MDNGYKRSKQILKLGIFATIFAIIGVPLFMAFIFNDAWYQLIASDPTLDSFDHWEIIWTTESIILISIGAALLLISMIMTFVGAILILCSKFKNKSVEDLKIIMGILSLIVIGPIGVWIFGGIAAGKLKSQPVPLNAQATETTATIDKKTETVTDTTKDATTATIDLKTETVKTAAMDQKTESVIDTLEQILVQMQLQNATKNTTKATVEQKTDSVTDTLQQILQQMQLQNATKSTSKVTVDQKTESVTDTLQQILQQMQQQNAATATIAAQKTESVDDTMQQILQKILQHVTQQNTIK